MDFKFSIPFGLHNYIFTDPAKAVVLHRDDFAPQGHAATSRGICIVTAGRAGEASGMQGQRPGISAQPGPATENRPAPASTGPRWKTLVTGHLVKSSEDQSRPWPVNSGLSYCYQSQGRRDQNHRHQIPWQIVPGSKSPKDLHCFHGSRSRDWGQRPWPASPCASTTWRGIRNTGSGQRGRKRAERAASSKRGPWLTPSPAQQPALFPAPSSHLQFHKKPLDGAPSRVRGEAPLPSDSEPSRAHGLFTKHLQRAGCRRSPAGLARC